MGLGPPQVNNLPAPSRTRPLVKRQYIALQVRNRLSASSVTVRTGTIRIPSFFFPSS